jgi:hypothetical protein
LSQPRAQVYHLEGGERQGHHRASSGGRREEFTRHDLPAGEHTFLIEIPGRKAIRRAVEVKPGKERRVEVDILDTRRDRPWTRDRDGFRHPDLRGWVRESRGGLLRAALVLLSAGYARNPEVRGRRSEVSVRRSGNPPAQRAPSILPTSRDRPVS